MFAAGATGAIPATLAVTVVPSAMPPITVPQYTGCPGTNWPLYNAAVDVDAHVATRRLRRFLKFLLRFIHIEARQRNPPIVIGSCLLQ
jgi:hypothetical protein